MPAKEYHRTQRVADLLQQELARLLRKEIKDPRLHWVTISGVEVSRDLAHAKVLITPAVPTEQSRQLPEQSVPIEKLVALLNKASGFLRHELAQSLNLRITPRLHFVHDTSIEYGAKLSAIINEAIEQDERAKDAGSHEA